ncbi:methyl-accepting chemotaxis protein [Desulfosporosinus metallidurans]|uniref:Methyl-accepting chemotaxis protein n=1 Tax=Desulfosporosinus metallidurans TaxID=1888891 RepID=A0A1Q8QI37_9FIRM|nr:methyl-accepting chemotaxis protein [Desulfosporosinus metallidurans]OLN26952.1 Methyl-accepting chemotaxis protein [Desulfosporosinus metallidurans]
MSNEKSYNLSDDQLLETYGDVAATFNKALVIFNAISITNKEVFLRNIRTGHDGPGQWEGKPFPENSIIPSIIKTGVPVTKIVPKEVYGSEFKSTTVPIPNKEGNIIGTLTLSLSLENQNNLQKAIEEISSSAEELSASTDEISFSAVCLSNNVAEALSETQEIVQLITQTNRILDFINHVASNSRLLGLNAAIEAARAGESGRGFAVVADEIRKMAENSSKSVSDTKKIISSINTMVDHLLNKIQELSDVALTQAAATQEVAACLQNLESNSQVVQNIALVI